MGLLFTKDDSIDYKQESVIISEKFQEYQDKFGELLPPRELYIDDNGDVIISTSVTSGSSEPEEFYMARFVIPWENTEAEEMVYKLLEQQYGLCVANGP